MTLKTKRKEMCSNRSTSLFPLPEDPPPLLHDRPGALLLQGTPALLVLLAWGVVEALAPPRSIFTRTERVMARLLFLGAAIALGMLAWRVFELLGCDGRVDDAEQWQIVGVGGVAAASILLALMSVRLPRAAAATFLLLAFATLCADWALRGGWHTPPSSPSPAAYPLVAVQQLFCVQAVLSLALVTAPLSCRPCAATVTPSRRGGVACPPPVELMHRGSSQDESFWSWQRASR